MQDLDRLPGGAWAHGVGWNRRPAALCHDGLVALDGGLGRLDVTRRQRRHAERGIRDPLPRGFRTLLGRKLIAMERTRDRCSGLRRLKDSTAASAAKNPSLRLL